MGFRINTNIQSLQVQASLNKLRRDQALSLAKLSSGSRITKSADDSAGLGISEKLKAHIRGSRQGIRNANDGISMVQIAEGGMDEISNILIRLQELSIQSSSDTISDKERRFSNQEFVSLTKEVNRIANSTKFNGRTLLNGEGELAEFQIGVSNDKNLDRISYEPSATNITSSALGLKNLTVSHKEDAQENLKQIDIAIDTVNSRRAGLGALQLRLQSTVNNLENQVENLAAANSQIRDVDIASETAKLTQNNILVNVATTILTQANSQPMAAIKLLS